ncbi:uncharacterized protein [Diadema setosum]|uniref:uncharacterized protein n=1 Tax=Diadema setosum TaxID=31175 RepID=UPI003B3B909B
MAKNTSHDSSRVTLPSLYTFTITTLTLKKEVHTFQRIAEEQEQYSRRNCLRFHGIDETADEDTDQVIIKLVKEKLDIELQSDDLDRSHRIPVRVHQRAGERRPPAKPIIVKFTRYNKRRDVYAARSKLKGTNIYIHEDLTRERSDLLYKTRELENVLRTWTYDGRIFALTKDNKKVKVTRAADLDRI